MELLRGIFHPEEILGGFSHLFPMHTSPWVLAITFWTGSKVSPVYLHPGGRWLTVNLGDVIPDDVFAVFKGVIPHLWKDGPTFLTFPMLGFHPSRTSRTIPLACLFRLTISS